MQRVARQPRGAKDFAGELAPGAYGGFEQSLNCLAVGSEPRAGFRERTAHSNCSAIVERMRQRKFGMDPLQAQVLQRQTLHKWRCRGQGVNGRTNVVDKTWKSKAAGPGASANGWLGFVNSDRTSGPRHRDCGGQTVGTGGDNHHTDRKGTRFNYSSVLEARR